MKKHTPILLTASLLAVGTAFGDWTMVSDFQDLDADTIPRYFQFPESAAIYIDFFDPLDSTNKALFMDAGLRGVRCSAAFAAIALPEEVPLGTTITFKFDFFMAGPSFDLNAGLSPTDFVTDETSTIVDPAATSFGEFEAQIRMSVPLDVRDGSNFRTTLNSPPVGEWITIYIIADGGSKTVQGYIRSSAGLEKIEIPVGDLVNDFWNWRVGRDETLKAFYLGSSNSCERGYDNNDVWLIDNVYIDYTGVNLDGDEPIQSERWAGYPLNAGYADTGSFLGWVYPVGDMVYVVDWDSWIYLPETSVDPIGAWLYAYE